MNTRSCGDGRITREHGYAQSNYYRYRCICTTNRSERFISLLRGLSPCYLRIGGTEAQGLTFNATTGTADEELVVTRPAGGGGDAINNSTVSVLSDWDPPYLEDKFANFTIHGKNTHWQRRVLTPQPLYSR